MTIGERLRKIREEKGINQGDFASFLGISQQNLSNYEKNKRDIPEQIKIKIQQNGVNLNWLLTGVGEPFIQPATEPPKPAILQELEKTALEATAPKFAEHDNRFNKIEAELKQLRSLYEESVKIKTDMIQEPEPFYGAFDNYYEEPEETVDLPLAFNLAAGIPVEAVESTETYPVPVRLIPRKNRTYCVAKIAGTSMTLADIPDGSYVLLEYTSQPIQGEYMVVRYGENTTLKLLHQTEHGSWELLYCDGSEAKIELKEGRWEVKGRFIAVLPKKA